jgi:hypothetical protein
VAHVLTIKLSLFFMVGAVNFQEKIYVDFALYFWNEISEFDFVLKSTFIAYVEN